MRTECRVIILPICRPAGGNATHIEKVGTVVCAGGGVGVAPLLPIVEAFHKAGNRVIVVLAARTKELVILEEQMRANSDEVIVMTDDGSYGTKGLVTNGVESVINREKVDLCVAIGPAVMMKFVSALTKKYEIPTVASLNTIMVDGTGNVRRLPYYGRRKDEVRLCGRTGIRCSPSRFR